MRILSESIQNGVTVITKLKNKEYEEQSKMFRQESKSQEIVDLRILTMISVGPGITGYLRMSETAGISDKVRRKVDWNRYPPREIAYWISYLKGWRRLAK
jgi:hypothetical protein